MKKLPNIIFFAAFSLASAFGGQDYVLRSAPGKIGDVVARYGIADVRPLQAPGGDVYVVSLPPDIDPGQVASDANVKGIEADAPVVLELNGAILPARTRGDQTQIAPVARETILNQYLTQPATDAVNLPFVKNWTGSGSTIAILDTGVDPNHPVLAGSLADGQDFVNPGAAGGSELNDINSGSLLVDLNRMQSTTAILDARATREIVVNQSTTAILDQSTTAILDQSTTAILDITSVLPAFGHGTMVAGLAHLVAPGATIMPVKVFRGDGSSTLSTIVEGIYWAVDNGADVINMSFSMPRGSKELLKALGYANSKRVILIASAGNAGMETIVYPAGYSNTIGVGSTNATAPFARSAFSNYGDSLVSLAAPGEGVVTLYPGGHYAKAWGTSFSSPLVAGGAALLVQISAGMNATQARQSLEQATPIPFDAELGAGELDLFSACMYRASHKSQ